VEVVGAHVGGGDVDGLDAVCFYVNYAALHLKSSFDIEEASAGDDDSIALEEIGSDDYVCDASFVFERQEDEALGSAGTLTSDDTAGDADVAVVFELREFVCGSVTFSAEMRTMICDRVRSAGEAGAGVVGCEALVGCHLTQREFVWR